MDRLTGQASVMKVQGTLSSHVYGPVASRRYGLSLGINVLPNDLKLCSYNCCYCECGWTKRLDTRDSTDPALYPAATALLDELEQALRSLDARQTKLDAITFAGNGEPTLHPEFLAIARGTADLRDRFAPGARLVLLSNATTLDDPTIIESLRCFDEAVMKLDAGRQETFKKIDIPHKSYTLDQITDVLQRHPQVTIQTLFLTGRIDNTLPAEIDAWLARLRVIHPRQVQIYSIERNPPDRTVSPVPRATLDAIAARVRQEVGVPAEVYA